MNSMERAAVEVKYASSDLSADQFDHEAWSKAEPVSITHYWSGEFADPGRHAEARLLWTPNAFIGRFEANQAEPLIVANMPDLSRKTLGLWDRDVCEIFLAPNTEDPYHYFEFEAAPTAEYVDLKVHLDGEVRNIDWDFQSGMTAAARVNERRILIGIRVPWSSDIPQPESRDEWLGNLCRCVGKGEDRGYLAWQPTFTEKANFHVPERFGRLRFRRP